MSFNPNRIHVGPARIFVGVTAPGSGLPPTKVGHTAGVPSTGTEVGLTEGDTVFTYTPKKGTIGAEQYYTDVDDFLISEDCSLAFSAKEATVAALKLAFDGVGQYSDAGSDLFYFGQGAGAFACLKQSVFFSARQRVDPSKYIVGMIYISYPTKPLVFPFSKSKNARWAVELAGLADTTRTAGDAVGQFYIEK